MSEARGTDSIRETSPEELVARARAGTVVILDVRGPDEIAADGSILGSLFIPRGGLPFRVAELTRHRRSGVVTVCSSGVRSRAAALVLEEHGFSNVASLRGGLTAWRRAGLPLVDASSELSEREKERYARHLRLREIGIAGQRTLKGSRVLVVGAGGLGSPAALYLAAAGIGTLGIVDGDLVEASNLQRQILHDTERLGRRKAESAKESLERLNPDVHVVAHGVRLTQENAESIVRGYEVLVDGSDNLVTRYLLAELSVRFAIPIVHAAVQRFEGHIFTVRPGETACYACAFPEMPSGGLSPSCADAGVLGAVPGVLGSMQTLEVTKLLLGIGESLGGRLLTYDALSQTFREFKIARDPGCRICSR